MPKWLGSIIKYRDSFKMEVDSNNNPIIICKDLRGIVVEEMKENNIVKIFWLKTQRISKMLKNYLEIVKNEQQ